MTDPGHLNSDSAIPIIVVTVGGYGFGISPTEVSSKGYWGNAPTSSSSWNLKKRTELAVFLIPDIDTAVQVLDNCCQCIPGQYTSEPKGRFPTGCF